MKVSSIFKTMRLLHVFSSLCIDVTGYCLVSPTCLVCAACGVKRAFPQSDLMRYDGKAVDVSFLRGTLSLQVLWSRPQA